MTPMQTAFDFIWRNWILIVVLGNLFIAASNIISKVILSGSVAKPLPPAPYAFVTGIWGLFAFSLAWIFNPWLGLLKFELWEGSFGLLAGVFYILSSWLFYYILERKEASRVMTILIGSVPSFAFFLKYKLLDERLSATQIIAFLFLIGGTILVSLRQAQGKYFSFKDLFLTVLAGLGFALANILAETGFKLQGFFSGLIWIVLGYGLAALIPLLLPSTRRQIFSAGKRAEKGNILMFLIEKLFSLSGSFIIKFAFTLQSVTLVTALEGIKQFFVLLIVGLTKKLAKWQPEIFGKYWRALEEELSGVVLRQKILAAFLVAIGIFLLITGK